MKTIFRCFVKTLSPVHLGCDEVYEPTGFVMDEQAGQMVVFDPASFFAQMKPGDKDKFSRICLKGTVASILEIYKFLRYKKAEGRRIDVCNGFMADYGRTLSISVKNEKAIQKELNQFIVSRTAFCPGDQRPYIPGSAVKGSLRTAYLNAMARIKKVPHKRGRYAAKDLEKSLLDGGAFQTDPFRLVKVSDFMPVAETKTRILYAVNEKKRPSKFEARGPYQILEVIEPGSVFEGEIAVEQPEKGAGIRNPISLENLLKSAVRFYTKEKTREDGELNRIGISGVPVPADARLLRLGRHSGAESVTIEGHRNIRIMGKGRGDNKYLDHATTLWPASELSKPKSKKSLQPFGWAELGELDADLAAEYDRNETEWRNEADAELEKRRADAEAYQRQQRIEKEIAAEEARTRELEEKRKQEEAERRESELAAMSPEERDIAELSDPSVIENRVIEIFNRTDDFSEENKKPLALALRNYWQAHGKWKKKKCSKKQWVKVQKIKGILGE